MQHTPDIAHHVAHHTAFMLSIHQPAPATRSSKPAPSRTLTLTKKTHSTVVSVPPSSIAALIQQDKAKSKALKSSSSSSSLATRLPSLLVTSSLSAHLAAKVQDASWSARQEKTFVEWINHQLVGQAQPNGKHKQRKQRRHAQIAV